MQTLNGRISRYMRKITAVLVIALIISIMILEVINEQRREYEAAGEIFARIEKILEDNKTELEEVRRQYSQTCLESAEGIAYILEQKPDAKDDREELEKIASFMGVDEIHIIDKTGKIVSGTHPNYYGYTFASGKQISTQQSEAMMARSLCR